MIVEVHSLLIQEIADMDSVSVLAYLSSIVISIVSSIWYYKYRKEQNLLSWQQDILDKAETITVDAPAALIKHSKEFHQSVVRIKDRIHVAIGYGLANVILIEGFKSLYIQFDTLD